MTQVARGWAATMTAQVWSYISPCGICCRQSSNWTGFLISSLVSSCQPIHQCPKLVCNSSTTNAI